MGCHVFLVFAINLAMDIDAEPGVKTPLTAFAQVPHHAAPFVTQVCNASTLFVPHSPKHAAASHADVSGVFVAASVPEIPQDCR